MIDTHDPIPDALTLAAELVRSQEGEYAELHRKAGIRMRQLFDENYRLRAALAVFADPENWIRANDGTPEWEPDYDPIDFSRRALEGKP